MPGRMGQTEFGRGDARGFTLVEVLVAVAAVSVITVAIAGVFATVGETVRTGQSVSRFTTAAARIERQMREDIENMARDGVLAIRHELVGDTDLQFNLADLTDEAKGVSLSEDDPRPRARRADEMTFFRRGRFTTQRQPVVPGLTPVGEAARIYYGHGIRFPEYIEDSSGNRDARESPQAHDAGFVVDAGDTNLARLRLGGDPSFSPDQRSGPNAFASEWTLLRHVTALVDAGELDGGVIAAGQRAIDAGLTTAGSSLRFSAGANAAEQFILANNEYQVGGQTAAGDVFGTVALLDSDASELGEMIRRVDSNTSSTAPAGGTEPGNNIKAPVFASGLVDLATTSLENVRETILRSGRDGGTLLRADNIANNLGRLDGNGDLAGPGGFLSTLNPNYQFATIPNKPFGFQLEFISNHQMWLMDLFPTNNHFGLLDSSSNGINLQQMNEGLRTRMRFEDSVPGLLEAMVFQAGGLDFALPDVSGNEQFERNIAIADRQMLSSSIFAPGVTEMIIEWSFGVVVPNTETDPTAGELVWHGLSRLGDANFDGNVGNQEYLVRHYPYDRDNNFRPYTQPVRDLDGVATTMPLETQGLSQNQRRIQRLVHPQEVGNNGAPFGQEVPTSDGPSLVLYSLFGIVDPGHNGGPGTSLNLPATVDWPWPKLIRVTMSLADPNDPLIEETFQFVFKVPER